MLIQILLICLILLGDYAFYRSGYYKGKTDGLKEAEKIIDEVISGKMYQKKAEIISEYLLQEGIK